MPAKIRLQRHGKKGAAFFHVVVADGRAPRDGRFIEKIGVYNPITNPATIDLNFERALHWVQCGAQPTETTRALLSYKGVLYKDHLLRGVKKGALTEDQVETRFAKWLTDQDAKIQGKVSRLAEGGKAAYEKRMAEEKKRNQAVVQRIAEKQAAAAAVEAPAEAPAEDTTEGEATPEAASEE
jgi:small subunit ribosomal protein S16